MAKSVIPTALRERVIRRALHRCEYCQCLDKFHSSNFTMDHLLPQSMNGPHSFENFAYACSLCNRLKSNKLKVFDEQTGAWIDLFNPRIHNWKEHFTWSEDETKMVGVTAIGRITIITLKLNRTKLLECRIALIPFREHPPKDV